MLDTEERHFDREKKLKTNGSKRIHHQKAWKTYEEIGDDIENERHN